MTTFRKVELNISLAPGYGKYYITATYKGEAIKVDTTNSECFDWLNDASNKVKHQAAKKYAYNTIVNAYKNI
jgi:hypothetical protein